MEGVSFVAVYIIWTVL